MNASVVPADTSISRAIGLPVFAWLVIALLNFLSQIFLRRELAPGEFGTVNVVLGVVAVLAAPLLALDFFFNQRAVSPNAVPSSQAHRRVIMEMATLGWGGISLVLLFVLLPLLDLPRTSLHILSILAVGAALFAVLSGSLCASGNRLRFWTTMLVVAAAVRVIASAAFGYYQPWAQSGIAAVIIAGIVTAIPALQPRVGEPSRAEAWTFLRSRDFLVPCLATISILLALALFTNADRIVAQSEFGTPDHADMGYVDPPLFDDYQTAGLLGRALLWGTLPLLWVFYANRAALARSTFASFRFFWFYLGALVIGTILLVTLAPMWSAIFSGYPLGVARFIPGFAGAMFMLGILQGIAIFALASRRYIECFTLGACSIAYTIFLYLFGHQPQVMTTCMFGGALVSLMIVLLVGVTRYARNHP